MGVIHKLKQEVAEFIIQKKKENPRLSCRKMAAIVEDQFSMQLSKSSINNLLRNIPVGRYSQSSCEKTDLSPGNLDMSSRVSQETVSSKHITDTQTQKQIHKNSNPNHR
jgi:hypothetical protein